MDDTAGVTTMDDSVGKANTVTVTAELVVPVNNAVTLVVPGVTAVNEPSVDMVATFMSELVHVAFEVILAFV